jgi:hypothetical protein
MPDSHRKLAVVTGASCREVINYDPVSPAISIRQPQLQFEKMRDNFFVRSAISATLHAG